MAPLEDVVRYETAHSGLAFREHVYGADDRAELVRDLLALANAAATGPRFLFVGVRDTVGGQRAVVGLTIERWGAFTERLGAWLGGTVEPALKVVVRTLTVDGANVGMLCLTSCEDPPYLLTAQAPAGLPAGAGWVRRGTQQVPLLRSDLQRLFAAKLASAAPAADVRIGFPGEEPERELAVPELPLDALPSALAAHKIRKLLEAKESAKAMFGRTETRFSRLVHAQVFGVEQAYESHSEDSLRLQMTQTTGDYREADEHYRFETRAHRLALIVANAGTAPLEGATLRMQLPRLATLGIAERLYPAPGAQATEGYPLVKLGTRTTTVETDVPLVPARGIGRVFHEPPRLWVLPGAERRSVPLQVTLHARQLREPVSETLLLRIVAPPKARRRS